ncbi:MAG TPA: type II toxin-antitoxin system RelE/ParE family toxin [Pyrinomonadaceae bacterium]
MNEPHPIKHIVWIGSSLTDLRSYPDEVRDVIGYALYQAQVGRKAPSAKPLTGFRGASVVEIVEDYYGDAYRAVYPVKFPELVYVLHAFQKKSNRGIATPKRDIDLIKKRLKVAENDYKLRREAHLR